MLKQRVITAVIMVAVLVAAVAFLPLPGLALAFGVVVCLGGWEWARLAGWISSAARAAYAAILASCLVALYFYCELGLEPQREQVQPFLGLACLWWSIALLWVKAYPGSAVLWGNRAMRNLMGLLILAPAWLAAVYLLSFPHGGLIMLGLVVIVAAADVGAYFSGRAWGKHKLAPQVSPAKTWEGFWGGVGCTVLLALLVWYGLPMGSPISLTAILAVIVATALASVVGDLVESMVKRESGVKDSGSLLPGHGGVLDRLDSLSAAAPVYALGLLLAGW